MNADRIRDNQRQRLYNAERHAFRFNDYSTLMDWEEVQEYVREIEASRFWSEILDANGVRKAAISIRDGRGYRSAMAYCRQFKIVLPKMGQKGLRGSSRDGSSRHKERLEEPLCLAWSRICRKLRLFSPRIHGSGRGEKIVQRIL